MKYNIFPSKRGNAPEHGHKQDKEDPDPEPEPDIRECVPPLILRPRPPCDSPQTRLKQPHEDEHERLETPTQKFITDRDINAVRQFSQHHTIAGLCALETLPPIIENRVEGRRPCPKKSKMQVLYEGQKDPEKPLLITFRRPERSPNASSRDLLGLPGLMPGTMKCSSPTSVSFIPGKDIAENRSFLQAFVEVDPGKRQASSQSVRQSFTSDQGISNLNYPCKCPIVLIVDDTEINKIVLSGMLSRLDLQHLEACNGLEALEVLREQNRPERCSCLGIKLVLMDCGMPVMNGFDATSEIVRMIEQHEITSTTVVAVTAYEGATIEQECKDAGMAEYINKPVTLERLLQCLHKYLDS
jgi:CheY-like chemotaxis protein